MRYLVGNWKCHPDSLQTALEIAKKIEEGLTKKILSKVEVILLPPSPFLHPLSLTLEKIRLGAQRGFWVQEGAFTGEVSPLLFRSVGARYILVGHSERRSLVKYTPTLLREEVFATLDAGLTPIFCFGEKTRRGDWLKRIREELRKVIPEKLINKIILAYEPVWAIGREEPASLEEVEPVVGLVLELFKDPTILYGGSLLSPEYIPSFLKLGFSGFLVGRASLEPSLFLSLAQILAK